MRVGVSTVLRDITTNTDREGRHSNRTRDGLRYAANVAEGAHYDGHVGVRTLFLQFQRQEPSISSRYFINRT